MHFDKDRRAKDTHIQQLTERAIQGDRDRDEIEKLRAALARKCEEVAEEMHRNRRLAESQERARARCGAGSFYFYFFILFYF